MFHLNKPGSLFLPAKCVKKHLWKIDIFSKDAGQWPASLVKMILTRDAGIWHAPSMLNKLHAQWRACMQHACKEVFACTELHAHKSIKTFLSSA